MSLFTKVLEAGAQLLAANAVTADRRLFLPLELSPRRASALARIYVTMVRFC